MGKWVPLVGIFKELAPWRSTQPVWEWVLGVYVLFSVFPLGYTSS